MQHVAQTESITEELSFGQMIPQQKANLYFNQAENYDLATGPWRPPPRCLHWHSIHLEAMQSDGQANWGMVPCWAMLSSPWAAAGH